MLKHEKLLDRALSYRYKYRFDTNLSFPQQTDGVATKQDITNVKKLSCQLVMILKQYEELEQIRKHQQFTH